MIHNVSFIGGIHGVGKSSVCEEICSKLNIVYLSASKLIRWAEMNSDSQNKLVKDISHTQDRLIAGLKSAVQPNKTYLLDGHYCLLNSNSKIEEVPTDTFLALNPISLNLVVGDVAEIKKRLEERDSKVYDLDLLTEMQAKEVEYANTLSKTLGITLTIGTSAESVKMVNSLREILTKK